MIFLQFNPYYKMTLKFFMKNVSEKHEMMSKRVFEGNSTNKSI